MVDMNDLIKRYPSLEKCKEEISALTDLLIGAYEKGGKLLICGNGGSAADCEHISGELLKGFMNKRPLSDEKKAKMRELCPEIEDSTLNGLQMGLAAIPLTSLSALNSAFANDVDPDLVYAQSVMALGNDNDVLLAISTSGNAKNVVNAAKVAKALGMSVIGLCGESGGKLKGFCDVCVCVPECETYKVQELHLPVYHYVCEEIEKYFFG